MFGLIKKIFGSAQDRQIAKYRKIVASVNHWEEQFQQLTDEQLKDKTTEFKKRLQKGESLQDLLPEAYAVVKNTCRRLCGQEIHVSGYKQNWDMIPYDVQIIGAIAMHYGFIAEMQTGEGKTLTACLPLYLNALTGKPVHLVTVNDYLVMRDCQWTGSIFRWLGLSTGALTADVLPHERGAVYSCDIVYGTSSEFGFDYLRDHSSAMRKEEQVQRGHYFAIIDEVDSILIDEARTPLIISGPAPVSRQMYDELKEGVAALVLKQRDLCNKWGSEAKKIIDATAAMRNNGEKIDKEQAKLEDEAFQKLWLISKTTPRNRLLKKIQENPDMRHRIEQWDVYYYSDQNKEEKIKALADLYVIVDERANEYELTDLGINTWTSALQQSNVYADDFVLLDLGAEYLQIEQNTALTEEEKMQRKIDVRQKDALIKERMHNLRQLLRAHLLMERDIDYIVQDRKIIIVDENTGRPQPGRRFSDGLHQALEAKESVPVQGETQTYATVTLQNYFRMYTKLAGMSGTAITEAKEFKEIYNIDVLQIPTFQPSRRIDSHDEIYMTEREKYAAIVKAIQMLHEQGRPILVGTESVDVSEKLSHILRQKQIPHHVLNAKQHDKEAEIIANAGTRGAVTIATNMAGRGTDIKLAPGVAEIKGLHVIGTTRHQSRRIDRQLRGRCGRLGDPGSSQFYVSFEDQLLRMFSSPRLTAMLKRLRPPEGEPISASMLDKSIETAQKRIEQKHYMIRKHTLEYDNVMNKQRQEVYRFRDEILQSSHLYGLVRDLLESTCATVASKFFVSRSTIEGWDGPGYRNWLMEHFPLFFEESYFEDDYLTVEQIEEMAAEKVLHAFDEKYKTEEQKGINIYSGDSLHVSHVLDDALRMLLVNQIDTLWQEHLLAMDHLRAEIQVRSIGQKDPLIEFKHEAFALFDRFSFELKTESVKNIFQTSFIQDAQPLWIKSHFSPFHLQMGRHFLHDLSTNEEEDNEEEEHIVSSDSELLLVSTKDKEKRNDLCSCESGKKYKKCCGQYEE